MERVRESSKAVDRLRLQAGERLDGYGRLQGKCGGCLDSRQLQAEISKKGLRKIQNPQPSFLTPTTFTFTFFCA
jgi:hypothetical protein